MTNKKQKEKLNNELEEALRVKFTKSKSKIIKWADFKDEVLDFLINKIEELKKETISQIKKL